MKTSTLHKTIDTQIAWQEIENFLWDLAMKRNSIVFESSLKVRSGGDKKILLKGIKMARELGLTIVQ